MTGATPRTLMPPQTDTPGLDQARLVAALSHPAVFGPGCARVERLETHISCVFLTGRYAYKIKKAVALGFLDFTALEARRTFCEEELRLNRRLAPALYLDVVPITGSIDGPVLGGDGPALEYAVKMREFPQDALASRILARGELSTADIDTLAAQVAAFHGAAGVAAPGSAFGAPNAVLRVARQNFTQVRPLLATVEEHDEVDALSAWTESEHARVGTPVRCVAGGPRAHRRRVPARVGNRPALTATGYCHRRGLDFGCRCARPESGPYRSRHGHAWIGCGARSCVAGAARRRFHGHGESRNAGAPYLRQHSEGHGLHHRRACADRGNGAASPGLDWPLVFYPVHIVFLEFVIDPACSIAFEAEPSKPDATLRPPRPTTSRLFGGSMVATSFLQGVGVLIAVALLYALVLGGGTPEPQARAMAFAAVVLGNVGLILSNRSRKATLPETLRRPNRAPWWIVGRALLGAVGGSKRFLSGIKASN